MGAGGGRQRGSGSGGEQRGEQRGTKERKLVVTTTVVQIFQRPSDLPHARTLPSVFSADLDIISEEPLRISMVANKPGRHDISE